MEGLLGVIGRLQTLGWTKIVRMDIALCPTGVRKSHQGTEVVFRGNTPNQRA